MTLRTITTLVFVMAVPSLQKWVNLTPNTMAGLHASAVGLFSEEFNNLPKGPTSFASTVEIVSSL